MSTTQWVLFATGAFFTISLITAIVVGNIEARYRKDKQSKS